MDCAGYRIWRNQADNHLESSSLLANLQVLEAMQAIRGEKYSSIACVLEPWEWKYNWSGKTCPLVQ